MVRLIDADLVHRAKFHTEDLIYKRGWNDALDGVAICAPTVDAVPVRHGKWMVTPTHIKCSECGESFMLFPQNYCPNCGARMDKE